MAKAKAIVEEEPTGTLCVLCGAAAKWTRPASAKLGPATGRCDEHTPDWRVMEYEPLTPSAQARRHAAEVEAMPRPKGEK